MYYATIVLDPRIKTTLIWEQYSTDTNNYINRIRTYLKTEFGAIPPLQTSQITLKLPLNASLYQIGLLQQARQSNASLASDIDLYLDTPPIA